MALIVEVLHPRTGAVVSRRRVGSAPFTIGRALDNALVLDDPHVDAHHAGIVIDGETGDVLVEDRGSLNGIQTDSHPRAERVRVRSGAEVRLGRTTLRFRDESDPVAAAIPLHGVALDANTKWHQQALPRLAFCFAVYLFLGWLAWLDTATRSGTNEALGIGLAFAGLNALWAGIWAIVARVVIHQGRFVAHFTIATFFFLVTMLLGTFNQWVQFLWPDLAGWSTLTTTVTLVLLSASVAMHLANASWLSRARRWRAGVIVSAVVVALGGVFALADDDGFTDVPEFSPRLVSIMPRLVPQLAPDELREAHAGLRADVDALADEPD